MFQIVFKFTISKRGLNINLIALAFFPFCSQYNFIYRQMHHFPYKRSHLISFSCLFLTTVAEKKHSEYHWNMKKGKESVVHRCCAQTPISANLAYFSCLIQVCFKAFSVRKVGIHVLERTVTLYINQYCNFPVDITSLEFLYPHGVGCLHSQLQIGKIAKEKNLPCF